MAVSKIPEPHDSLIIKTIGYTSTFSQGDLIPLNTSIADYDFLLIITCGYDNYMSNLFPISLFMEKTTGAFDVAPVASGYSSSFRFVDNTTIRCVTKDTSIAQVWFYGIKI